MKYTPSLWMSLALLISAPASQAITYHAVETAQAAGHGGNFSDGYIRGNGSDSNLAAFGIPQAFANPRGALSTGFQYNLPFGQAPVAIYVSGIATWDNFEVSGNSVNVRSFELETQDVRTNQSTFSSGNVGAPSLLSASFDGRMHTRYTLDFAYTGAVPDWQGTHTEVDIEATGGYVLNDPSTGLRSASAAQFSDLGSSAQGAADYLNLVVENFLPDNWTQAGLWLYSGQYTQDNTRGFFADSVIGGSYAGYNVWYSTDAFVFGQPLPGANGDGLFTSEAVAELIASGEFPELGGLQLAGQGFAQLFDIHTIGGDGTSQTITIKYDDTVLAPGEEALLSVVHFTNEVWETPAQVLDVDANTVTLTVTSFSPFALVSTPVPLPAGLGLLSAALGLLGVHTRRLRRI
jgi:hypothetical protein